MKESLGAKTWAAPTPVWVVGTYDEKGRPNFMTAAWGGVCLGLREETYSHGNREGCPGSSGRPNELSAPQAAGSA